MEPPPFRFVVDSVGKTGPAFTRSFKVLATVIVLACGAALARTWLDSRYSGGATGGGWFVAALLLMLYTWWHILSSVTCLDAQGLHQTWMWDKRMEFGELAYGKLIRVSGFDWLIAPRLYVRTFTGKFAVFYAASPAMLREFERLAIALKALHNPR